MQTPNDSHDTDGAVSVRWRAHVPVALVGALVMLLNGGACSKQDETIRKLDDLNTRVSRIEGALGVGDTARNDGVGGVTYVTNR